MLVTRLNKRMWPQGPAHRTHERTFLPIISGAKRVPTPWQVTPPQAVAVCPCIRTLIVTISRGAVRCDAARPRRGACLHSHDGFIAFNAPHNFRTQCNGPSHASYCRRTDPRGRGL
jgi:hypothetical protein